MVQAAVAVLVRRDATTSTQEHGNSNLSTVAGLMQIARSGLATPRTQAFPVGAYDTKRRPFASDSGRY
jgi:hypothetical protein